MRRTVPVLAGALAVVVAVALVARGGGGPTVDERVRSIASSLRCPVCQNLSVADSPSRLAREMRGEIEGRVRAGHSDEEVRAFFVRRYGEWVLLEPASVVPWLLPVAAVTLGLVAWAVVARRRPRPDATDVTDAERERIRREVRTIGEEA